MPANLTSGSYSGSSTGVPRVVEVAATKDGTPVVVKPLFTDSSNMQTQVYTFAGGRWVNVPVGPRLNYKLGVGVAVNNQTNRVNVVLLDPGSASSASRILLYHQPVADLMAGKANWTQEVVASFPNGQAAATAMRTAIVEDTRFAILYEPNWSYPNYAKPVYLEAPIR